MVNIPQKQTGKHAFHSLNYTLYIYKNTDKHRYVKKPVESNGKLIDDESTRSVKYEVMYRTRVHGKQTRQLGRYNCRRGNLLSGDPNCRDISVDSCAIHSHKHQVGTDLG